MPMADTHPMELNPVEVDLMFAKELAKLSLQD
jgi:hypothetical protein